MGEVSTVGIDLAKSVFRFTARIRAVLSSSAKSFGVIRFCHSLRPCRDV